MTADRDSRQIRNDERYEAPRADRMTRQDAARLGERAGSEPRGRGDRPEHYEDLTKDQLYAEARELGLEVDLDMSKHELIEALRAHS